MADGSASESSQPACSNKSLGSPDHNPRSIFFPERGPLSPTDKLKSPTCPRGKTIRDFEEELVELRKENFDLKMRIYIMEEHRDMFHGIENVDELYKMNADLKAEIEKVKTELADKEDLILQAAKAMESLEARHNEEIKKITDKFESDKLVLEQAYNKLQGELSDDRKEFLLEDTIAPPTPNRFDNSMQMYAMLYSNPSSKQEEINEKNQLIVSEMDERIKELSEVCDQKDFELQAAQSTIAELKEVVMQLTKDLKEATEKRLAAEDKLVLRTEEKAHLEEIVAKLKSSSDKGAQTKTYEKQSNDVIKRLEFLESELKVKSSAFEKLKIEHIKALQTTKGLIKQNKALMKEVSVINGDEAVRECKKPECFADCPGEEALIEEMKSKAIVEIPKVDRHEGSQGFSMFIKQCELKSNRDDLDEILGIDKKQDKEKEIQRKDGEEDSFDCGDLHDIFWTSKKDEDKEKKELKLKLEAKDKKIESLNEELRKRTCNLQGLVNTELWDKNREIEKLNKAFEKKQAEVTALKSLLNVKDVELKSLTEQLEELNQRLQEVQKVSASLETNFTEDFHAEILHLRRNLEETRKNRDKVLMEANRWKKEAEDSEKARKELINACTLLTKRLEELVTFLECLAPSPETKEGRMIQEAIIRSREVSRSFSFSFRDLSAPILPDFSQVDFCSETDSVELLDPVPKVDNDEVIKLRTQVESLVDNLRNKVDGLESKKKKPWVFSKEDGDVTQLEDVTEGSAFESINESCSADNNKTPVNWLPPATGGSVAGCLSESEGWSEPDRNVSMARIGIKEESISSSCKQATPDSSDSHRHSLRTSVTPPSGKRNRHNYMELRCLSMKVKTLEHTNESLRDELNALKEKQLTAVDKAILCQIDKGTSKAIDELNRVKAELEKSSALCNELKTGTLALELENKDLREKLAKADAEIIELQSVVKEKENHLLEKQCSLLEAQNRELVMSEKLNELSKLNEKLKSLNKELKDTKINWKAAEEKVEQLLAQIQSIKSKHDKEMLTLLNEKNCEKDSLVKEHHMELKEVEKKLEEIRHLKEESENEMKIKFDSFEKEKSRELDNEIRKRMELEKNLSSAYEYELQLKSRIDAEIAKAKDIEIAYKLDQRRWTRKLTDLEESMIQREKEWRRKLDNAIVDHSRIVLERARMTNDKLCLKSELSRREGLPNSLKSDYEKHLGKQEEGNVDLELRLVGSPSLPSSPRAKVDYSNCLMLTRQASNPSSDYMSDPEPPQGSSQALVWSCRRRNNNCSPDLGIESDQGRLDGPQKSLSATDISYSASLKAENEHLKRQLVVVNEALQSTLSQLSTANHRKRQVEKAICLQLTKTHKILQKARVNIEPKEGVHKNPH